MKKILFVLCLGLVGFGYGQNVPPPQYANEGNKENKEAKFGMYIEGLGNAFWGSFNLEAIVVNTPKYKLAAKAGVGLTPDLIAYANGDPYAFSWESFPIGVNSILFEGNSHLEIGLGGLIYPMGYYPFHTNMNIGYRFQKPSKGLLFRVGATFDFAWLLPWAHISIGYYF